MESAIQTVVAGEASESDDDEPSVQTPKVHFTSMSSFIDLFK